MKWSSVLGLLRTSRELVTSHRLALDKAARITNQALEADDDDRPREDRANCFARQLRHSHQDGAWHASTAGVHMGDQHAPEGRRSSPCFVLEAFSPSGCLKKQP